jgi:hypothetical protein
MPFYLRAINKNRWRRSAPPPLLPEGDLPAQPLADLVPRPEENLSLWYIDDEKINLDRVAAAIASSRDRIDKLDYALFAQEVVGNLGITIVQSPGESPDEHANISWHWEVIDLTASQVVRLAKEIYLGAEIGRKSQIAIKGLINQGIESKQLQQGKVSSKLLEDLK